ncbi:MAG: hypothetical protein QUV05_10675 [Phycisphaerae bacterium]|nr:hypothetical protein [Phycisphaerae bacterium]
MTRRFLLLAMVVSLTWCAGVSARYCTGITDPVFCDDFDRWCSPAPEDPAASCDRTTTIDQAGFLLSWVPDDACTGASALDQLSTANNKNLSSLGYGVEVTTHNGTPPIELVRHSHDLKPEILNNPENTSGYGSINGAGTIESHYALYPNANPNYVDAMDSTLSPETLKGHFSMNLGTCGHYGQMLFYMELSLDDDHAPVNFATSECDYWVDCTCNTLHPGTPGCAAGEQATCDSGELAGMPCSDDSQCSKGPTRQTVQAGDGTVHNAFAIGLMPLRDGTPCYEGDGPWPQAMWRLMVYDGLVWQQFQAPKFDIPMTPNNIMPDAWDLRPWDGWNTVDFAIGADYVEVRLRNTRSESYAAPAKCVTDCGEKKCMGGWYEDQACSTDAECQAFDPSWPPPFNAPAVALPQPYFVARVPRQYTGPFNRISAGPPKGLDMIAPTCVEYVTDPELAPLSWKRCRGGERDNLECTTDEDCPASTTETCLKTFEQAWDVGLENVALYDGVFEPAGLGACCVCTPGSGCTCSDVPQEECISAGGTFHAGEFCDTYVCCPDPFADADADGDVDQADFGRFQACYTGAGVALGIGCGCFDAHPAGAPDNDVDSEDWTAFEACASGAGIAANAACDDAP